MRARTVSDAENNTWLIAEAQEKNGRKQQMKK